MNFLDIISRISSRPGVQRPTRTALATCLALLERLDSSDRRRRRRRRRPAPPPKE